MKKLLSVALLTLILVLPLPVLAAQIPAYFTDVQESHWAASYIYNLVERGVIKGKTPTLFAPEDNLTRAELVALLARFSREELPQVEIHFEDVADTAWYARELTWAVKAGIIQGVGDKRFAPQQAISRQDIALILMRYIDYSSLVLPPLSKTRTFSDSATISAYAYDAVVALQQAGFIGGYEDSSFRPKSSVTRAEATKLLVLIDDAPTGPQRITEFAVALASALWTFDPQKYFSEDEAICLVHLGEGLMKYKYQGGGVEPGLAESYDISDDGLVWTFHLRPGLKWSDG